MGGRLSIRITTVICISALLLFTSRGISGSASHPTEKGDAFPTPGRRQCTHKYIMIWDVFWEFPAFWGSHGPREDIPPLTSDQSEKLIVFRKRILSRIQRRTAAKYTLSQKNICTQKKSSYNHETRQECSLYEQLTDFDRGRIIGLREAGWSNRRIGRHLGRSDMVVARCWQQWITEGRVYRRGGSGRPRNTNDREDRAIRRVATSAPTTSLASIQRHLPPSRHPVPSRETIRRRLTECRLDFCRPRATWSVTDWRRVIFSDESRFSLSADYHRTRVWRRTGQRSDPAFIVERHTAISQGVTVWGAISWDTRSSLVVLQGTLTARRYVDDILTPIVLPMLSSHPGAIYQQDNARPHTARLSQQCLQGYDVLPWPTRSPDLSPIEHVWDALGRQLQPSRDTGELTAQMQRLWQDLPQGVISDLIESMPRRISACTAARGGFTTYLFLTFCKL
ncbi:transposable element Tcb1 transposase [Trichonephila clavipes]|nr:transposable element Tcb1 transposase [Trichonephila clavipes]